MNLLREFLARASRRPDTENYGQKDLSDAEVGAVYLRAVLSHVNCCSRDPKRAAAKYATLKEHFPEIVVDSRVGEASFRLYVRILYPEIDRRGDWQEGVGYLLLAIDTRQTTSELLAAHLWLSHLYGHLAEYEQASRFAHSSAGFARSLNDDRALVTAMNYLAKTERSQGSYASAVRRYEQIIKIARRTGNDDEVAHSYVSKGLTYWHLKEYEKALDTLTAAQQMAISLGNEERIGNTHNNIGLVYTDLGLYQEALDQFQRALTIARSRQDRREAALTEGNLGMAHFFSGSMDLALMCLRNTLRAMEDLHSYYRLAKVKCQIGWVYQSSAMDPTSRAVALQYCRDAYEIGLQYGIVHFEIIGASYQAAILDSLDRSDEARALSRMATTVLDRIRVFDGLEEEIYFNHYLVMRDVDSGEAVTYLRKAYEEVRARAQGIMNHDLRKSFLQIALHQRILAAADGSATCHGL